MDLKVEKGRVKQQAYTKLLLARMSHKFFRFCSEANDQRVSDQLGVFQPKFFSQIGKYDAAQSRFRIPFFSAACNIHGPLS